MSMRPEDRIVAPVKFISAPALDEERRRLTSGRRDTALVTDASIDREGALTPHGYLHAVAHEVPVDHDVALDLADEITCGCERDPGRNAERQEVDHTLDTRVLREVGGSVEGSRRPAIRNIVTTTTATATLARQGARKQR